MSAARDALRVISTLAKLGAPLLPGAGKQIAGVIAEGAGQGADLIEAGHDPVTTMRQIRDRAPLFAEMDRAWELELEKRFGPAVAAEDIYEPDGPDTEPGTLG